MDKMTLFAQTKALTLLFLVDVVFSAKFHHFWFFLWYPRKRWEWRIIWWKFVAWFSLFKNFSHLKKICFEKEGYIFRSLIVETIVLKICQGSLICAPKVACWHKILIGIGYKKICLAHLRSKFIRFRTLSQTTNICLKERSTQQQCFLSRMSFFFSFWRFELVRPQNFTNGNRRWKFCAHPILNETPECSNAQGPDLEILAPFWFVTIWHGMTNVSQLSNTTGFHAINSIPSREKIFSPQHDAPKVTKEGGPASFQQEHQKTSLTQSWLWLQTEN